MEKHSVLTRILITATSFAGGMALGMLLSPKSGRENRAWINRQTSDLTGWMDEQRKDVVQKGSRQLSGVRKKVQQGIKDNVPDLYDATKEIHLDDSHGLGV